MGLPPSGGFIAKWLMLNAAIDNGQWWWVVVMLVGGLLTALYIGRVLNIAFQDADRQAPLAAAVTAPRSLSACGLALALLAVLLGFNAEWLLALVQFDQGAGSLLSEAAALAPVKAGVAP